MPTRGASNACGCALPKLRMAEPAARRIWRRDHWLRLALMPCLGALAALGQAPFSLTGLSFAGFAAAFLVFSGISRRGRAFAAGLAFGCGYFGLALHWIVEPFLVDMARHGWMAPFALALMALGMSLFWGGAFALARPGGRAALVVTLTGAELLRAYLFGGFPWAMPAHALVDSLAGQGAAWLGPHGLNLLLLASAAALSAAPRQLALAGLGAGFLALSLWPLPAPAPPANGQTQTAAGQLAAGQTIVRLVQPNVPQHEKWDPEFMPVHFDRALTLTRTGGAGGSAKAAGAGSDTGSDTGPQAVRPDLIIWPETSVPAPLGQSSRSRAAIARAANGAPVLVGMLRYDGLRIYNSAVLLDARGSATQVYDKHHLVPFGEYVPMGDFLARFGIAGLAAGQGRGFSAGPGPELLDFGALGRALPLICYEAVFPQDLRGLAQRPDFLVQITNDAWFGQFSGPYQHLDQARMRAIEQGLPLLRAANTGVSAVIDAQGRLVASVALNTEGVIDAALPPKAAPTVYAATGDAPLAVVIALVCLAGLRRRGHEGH